MLEPMWEVGVQSGVRGLDSAGLKAKPGGSFRARSEVGSGAAGWIVTVGMAGIGGRAFIAFLTNFLWTYLSMIHFSRDSLSELGLGFDRLGGIDASKT